MDKWYLIVYTPAYNVEKTIVELLKRIKKVSDALSKKNIIFDSLILVNDGSSDRTAEVIRESTIPYIKLINKEKNEGAVAALFDGMDEVKRTIKNPEKTIVIRMDSDLEHQPEDIERLMRPLISGETKICVGYIPFDSRSGHLVVWFNKQIGIMENTKYLNKKIPQFCPGFNAVRGDLYLELLPLLNEKRAKFIEMYGKDMLTIDFVILAVAHKLGNEIHYVRLSHIEDKWIKKIPISKIASYFDYHQRTMDFLKKNP